MCPAVRMSISPANFTYVIVSNAYKYVIRMRQLKELNITKSEECISYFNNNENFRIFQIQIVLTYVGVENEEQNLTFHYQDWKPKQSWARNYQSYK